MLVKNQRTRTNKTKNWLPGLADVDNKKIQQLIDISLIYDSLYAIIQYMKKDRLSNLKNTKFDDLRKICTKYFGNSGIKGSHHIFKTPWRGDHRINIQKEGKMAKPYQVKLVLKALEKLKVKNEKS